MKTYNPDSKFRDLNYEIECVRKSIAGVPENHKSNKIFDYRLNRLIQKKENIFNQIHPELRKLDREIDSLALEIVKLPIDERSNLAIQRRDLMRKRGNLAIKLRSPLEKKARQADKYIANNFEFGLVVTYFVWILFGGLISLIIGGLISAF